jgi:diphthamide biosynthesis protein 7
MSSSSIVTTVVTPIDTLSADKDDDGSSSSLLVLDYLKTPLNACSIETWYSCNVSGFHKDEEDHDYDDDDDNNDKYKSDDENAVIVAMVPLCLGCYQLDERTGKRQGRLDLYAIPVMKRKNTLLIDRFGSGDGGCTNTGHDSPPIRLLNLLGGGGGESECHNEVSGILDGKWCPRSLPSRSRHPGSTFENYFATAHASGELYIHKICLTKDTPTAPWQQCPFQATLVGTTASPNPNGDGLCLALAWDPTITTSTTTNHQDASQLDTRIISSYSDGHAAIYRIHQRKPLSATHDDEQSSSTTAPIEEVSITLEHYWEAHKMFSNPAEVWCASFVGVRVNSDAVSSSSPPTSTTTTTTTTTNATNLVATGGDEGSWKVWDIRAGFTQPVYHAANDFDAGVTVISPHPRHPHLLAVGSYDETIRLYDIRAESSLVLSLPSSPSSSISVNRLFHSDSLGGGIWRLKWHPYDDCRLLIAVMHGGCRVVEFNHLFWNDNDDNSNNKNDDDLNENNRDITMNVLQEFREHESMTYGADWLVHRMEGITPFSSSTSSPSSSTFDRNHGLVLNKMEVEVATSCSFYDQAMYMWKTR